ncbi:MAG: uncharacterized membrane-anchored protein YhcB (DUF1043 family) [Gammaproteobacteria bacterium]|jgi:hypothetical protein
MKTTADQVVLVFGITLGVIVGIALRLSQQGKERTTEAETSLDRLHLEIDERKWAEEKVRQLNRQLEERVR